MAAKLSLSRAWEETRDVFRRDGRLIAIVALALLVLPSTVQTLVTPEAPPGELPEPGAWIIVALIAVAIGIIGQLSLIRLAIGPATTVGEAIGHGARRMPIYLVAMVMWIVPFLLVLFLLMGMARQAEPNPAALLAFFVVLIIMIFLVVRFIVALAVASAEGVGPVAILQRSWRVTAGNWWRLFAFLLLFLIAALCVMLAVGAVIGTLVAMLLGAPEGMNLSTLLIALATQLAVGAVTAVFIVMVARIYTQLAGRGEAQASVPSSGT